MGKIFCVEFLKRSPVKFLWEVKIVFDNPGFKLVCVFDFSVAAELS